jgi:hypothetical protein
VPAAVVPKEDHRADMTGLVKTVREKFKEYSADEISSLVEQAVRTARGEKG